MQPGQIMSLPEKRDQACSLIKLCDCAEVVRKERKKRTKNDAVVRLSSAIHEGGWAGVEADWERTPEFYDLWKKQSVHMLGRAEFRRYKLTKRVCSSPLRRLPTERVCSSPLGAFNTRHEECMDKLPCPGC